MADENWTEELAAQMQAHPELPVVIFNEDEELDIQTVMFDSIDDCIKIQVN